MFKHPRKNYSDQYTNFIQKSTITKNSMTINSKSAISHLLWRILISHQKLFIVPDGKQGALQKKSMNYRLQRKNSRNFLVIVYLVKKFIQSLKSCIQVNRLLKIKSYHLALLNDRSSTYKDGIEIGNAKNHFGKSQNLAITRRKAKRISRKFVTIITDAAEKMRFKKFIALYNEKNTKLKNQFKNLFHRFAQKIPIFDPDESWKIMFNWFIIILLILNISYMALILISQQGGPINEEDSRHFIPFAILPKFFFILEISINCMTAYYEKGILIKSKLSIFRNYFKKEFTWDFVSIILPMILEGSLNQTRELGKLVFLLRIIKLLLLFRRMEKNLHLNDKINGIYEVFKLFLSIIFVDHILACAWVYLAQIELLYNMQKTWFHEKNLLNEGWDIKYLYSLYYCTTTMITVGYGDITPFSLIEIAYCIVMMLVSSGMFAYSLSKFGNILQEMYKKDNEFKCFISDVTHFLRIRKVSKEVHMKIMRYLEYVHSEETTGFQRGEGIMKSLSFELRQELNSNIFSRLISKIEIFRETFSPAFLKELATKAQEKFYAPDDIIYKRNSIDDISMFFVLKGEVEFLFEGVGKVCRKGPETYFGEFSFFSLNPREYTVRSTQLSNLICINLDLFMEIIENYPADKEKYFMLKDFINVYQKLNVLKMACPSCKSLMHTIEGCPLLNYKPNKGIVIERFKKENRQNRKQRLRKSCKKLNARLMRQKIQMNSELFNINFPEILENGLEDDFQASNYEKVLQRIDMISSARVANSPEFQEEEEEGERTPENKGDEKNWEELMIDSSNSESQNEKKRKNSGQIFESFADQKISIPSHKFAGREVKLNNSTFLRANPFHERARIPLAITYAENNPKKLLSPKAPLMEDFETFEKGMNYQFYFIHNNLRHILRKIILKRFGKKLVAIIRKTKRKKTILPTQNQRTIIHKKRAPIF